LPGGARRGMHAVSHDLLAELAPPWQVSAPASGTTAVLVLQSSKDGQVIFRDDAQVFTLK